MRRASLPGGRCGHGEPASGLDGCGGEPDRIRTCDPLIKSQLLYQLSYGPITGRLFMNPARDGQVQKRGATGRIRGGGVYARA